MTSIWIILGQINTCSIFNEHHSNFIHHDASNEDCYNNTLWTYGLNYGDEAQLHLPGLQQEQYAIYGLDYDDEALL